MPEQSKFKVGMEYKTRGGHRARVYALDHGTFEKPYIHGAIYENGRWSPHTWHFSVIDPSDFDLMPNAKKVEGWINLYKDGFGSSWTSAAKAADAKGAGVIKTIHLVEEVEE